MKVLLITPPMVQLNTPYPAMPVISGLLKKNGVEAVHFDMSIALALKLFSQGGLAAAADLAMDIADPSEHLRVFLDDFPKYLRAIDCVIPFLQNKSPELAWRIAQPDFLPWNTNFDELDPTKEGLWQDNLYAFFGTLGMQDKARLMGSLFLDDIAEVFKEVVDPEFGFAKYGEHLAAAAPTFDGIYARLKSEEPTLIDDMIEQMTIEQLEKHKPDFVGVTAPFPGTVYGAFRVAESARRHAPGIKTVLGGGYVNSELREMDDQRVFEFFDYVCFDDGLAPWLGIVGKGEKQRIMTREGFFPAKEIKRDKKRRCEVRVSDYVDVDFSDYISMIETANPMNRLWTDGRWLKVQISEGCYWGKCAFCDVSLDYIGCYREPTPANAVDVLEKMTRATGIAGFHFTDEAISPALLRKICMEIIDRGLVVSWWCNVRLEKAFNEELVTLMAEAGCIGVSAGLECANDRLLKLMNKGITLEGARQACNAFSDASIMVHAYLMYAFPTQTAKEVLGALDFVRGLFEDGAIVSAYWHRFALTTHSPIAADPDRFGIKLLHGEEPPARFALNEIPYFDPMAAECDAMWQGLRTATFNYMRGVGLDLPVARWFQKN